MNLSEELADAVYSIQQRIQTQRERTKAELTIRKDELRLALAVSTNAEDLQKRLSELEQAVWQAEDVITALQKEIEEASENNQNQRRIVWESLLKACEESLDQSKSRKIHLDFQSALEAFAEQLSEQGFNAAAATEAEQVMVLRELMTLASKMRSRAYKLALEAARKLDGGRIILDRWADFSARKESVETELKDLLDRLKSHGQSSEAGLVGDILGVDNKTAKRLVREVLHPILVDAGVERNKGLAATDPLRNLARELTS